jgi:DNA polymerase I-like protein with 3'-5' exonuclease and polymerase domains
MIGLKWYEQDPECLDVLGTYADKYVSIKDYVQIRINQSKLVVGHHIMFDLHWLRRFGIDLSNIRVWDTQLAEFILSAQTLPMTNNKLDSALAKYGYPLEYWQKEIDTDRIPVNILTEYLKGDLVGTEQVFNEQIKQFEV